MHKFAVLIAARNEEAVISQLIESIQHQSYPSDDEIFVAADNCTDTAAAAREAGLLFGNASTEKDGKVTPWTFTESNREGLP